MSCPTCGLDADKLQELSAFIADNLDEHDSQGTLISALHKAQGLFGYLSRDAMSFVAQELQVPESYVYGVATFYSFFTLKPKGRYPISVCMGTACYVKGAPAILDVVRKQLQIEVGETTPDGLFSLQETRCIGACGLAPVMTIGDDVYGRLTADQIHEILYKYQQKRRSE